MAVTAPVVVEVEIISTVTNPANHNISTTTPELHILNTATNTYTTDTTAFSTAVLAAFNALATQTNEDNIEVRYKVTITDVNAPTEVGVINDPIADDQGFLTNPASAAALQSELNGKIAAQVSQAGYA